MANEAYDNENPDRLHEGNIRTPAGKGERTARDFAPIEPFDADRSKRQMDRQNRAGLPTGDDTGLQQRAAIMGAGTAKDFAPSAAEKAEKHALDRAANGGEMGDDEFWDKSDDDGPKGIRGWSKRRKAAAGGVAGVFGLGAITGVLVIGSGPVQFLHFAQLLQQFHFSNSDTFTDGRGAQLIEYARTRNTPERRNLGYFGDKIADHYTGILKDAGIEHGYNGRGRISHIDIDPETRQGQAVLAELEEKGIGRQVPDFDAGGGRTVTRVELGEERAVGRRAAITTTIDVLDMRGTSNSLAARLLKLRGAVSLHPLQNIARAADEKFFQRVEELRNKNSEYVANGTDTELNVTAEEPPPSSTSDPDAPDSDVTPAAAAATDLAADEATAIIAQEGTVSTRAANLRAGLAAGIGTGVGIAGFAALTCGLQKIGNEIGEMQTSNIVKPLIRTGMQVVAIGAQIKAGQVADLDINLEDLGALSQSLHDKENKTSWNEAESIRKEEKKTGGVPMDSSAIPGTTKPLFFDQLDTLLGSVPGAEGVCAAATSRAGNIVLTASNIVLGATGPFSLVANIAVEGIQQQVTSQFLPDLIRTIAGEQVATNVAGAMYGNYANFGAFLANNDRMWSLGGRFLSVAETVTLDEQSDLERRQDLQQKSMYARLLDLEEPDSLAAKTILENPTYASANNMASSALQAPLRSAASIFNNFSAIFMPRSYAAAGVYDYGVPEVGFSVAELDSDVGSDDPYKNAEYIEAGDKLTTLNSKYGKCFSTKIDAVTGKIETSNVVSYVGRHDDCSSPDPDLLKFRFYLADMTLAQALTCYSGKDEETCANIGFENKAESTSTGALPDGVVGIEEIVDLPPWLETGRGCHQSIADKTRQMLEAASAAGIELRGACWRSAESQINLRNLNCPDPVESPPSACSPPTAKPGTSNHEKGLAIDFHGMCFPNGRTCPSDPGWVWLTQHAAEYGFQQLSSEAWHWSVDGG